jgi:hypothetical protein
LAAAHPVNQPSEVSSKPAQDLNLDQHEGGVAKSGAAGIGLFADRRLSSDP